MAEQRRCAGLMPQWSGLTVDGSGKLGVRNLEDTSSPLSLSLLVGATPSCAWQTTGCVAS